MNKRLLIVLGLAAVGLASCGNSGTSTPSSSEHVHTYSEEWSYDDQNHWHAATCGHDVKGDEAPHNLVMDESGSFETCICGYVHTIFSSLESPTNLVYDMGKLTFSTVEHAKTYSVSVKKENTEVYSTSVTTGEVDLLSLEVGQYDVSVIAKAGSIESSPATLSFEHKYFKDGVQLLEAEDYVINDNHISVDEAAHGGKYALGFDDCGQGMYFQYYAYEAGERDVTIRYATGAPGSSMKMYLNNDDSNPVTVYFIENTGWFGDSKTMADVTVKANLVKGWNHIYLMKNGTASDEVSWGGWAQIDYITISGTNKIYDSTATSVPMLTEYRFEAEAAKWHWANQEQRPNMVDAFPSIGYLGEQNATGDGVTFNVNMPVSGTYKLKLAAGCDAAQRFFDVTVNDKKENTLVHMGNSWDVIAEDSGILVHLNAGANTIDYSRPENGNWSCIDYLKVEYVSNNDPTFTQVTGLKFEDGKISFNPIDGISQYRVVISKGETTYLDVVTSETSLDFPTVKENGVNVAVYAKNGFFLDTVGASITVDPSIITDIDKKLEAENATLGSNHVEGNEKASGGGFAKDFNNCGEGMYFRYYAYEAGVRELTIAYWTDAPGSKMKIRVNDNLPFEVVYNQGTGWFNGNNATASVKVNVTLAKGWNNIDLYKDGTASDSPQWGGWAQIDYIVISGTGKSFDLNNFDDLICESYRLEAESGYYTMSTGTPGPGVEFSNGYYLGNQDNEGNGVTYRFYVDAESDYKITFYCGGDGQRNVSMKVNGVDITTPGSSFYSLKTGNGWNVVAADTGFVSHLLQGWNTIQLARLSDANGGGWICIDYCMVTMVK